MDRNNLEMGMRIEDVKQRSERETIQSMSSTKFWALGMCLYSGSLLSAERRIELKCPVRHDQL